MEGRHGVLLPLLGRFSRGLSREDLTALEYNSEWLGIDRLTLMENAGGAVAGEVVRLLGGDPREKRIAVFAGRGNNGGDGFVAARRLAALGADVHVFLIGEPKTPEAAENLSRLRRMLTVEVKDLSSFDPDLGWDLAVDALLGTGALGRLRGRVLEAVKILNSLRDFSTKIVAVDVPTGIDAFSGEVLGEAVRADVTVTFHCPKSGLERREAGEVVVADVGAPPESLFVAGPGDLRVALGERKPWSHKGDFGRVLIIAGSERYSGAPTLASKAALASGADLAILATPSPAAAAAKSLDPNLIVLPLPGGVLTPDHLDELIPEVERADAVVVGPGLGAREETGRAVRALLKMLKEARKLTVVDADGLRQVGRVGGWPELVVTPHSGEFSRMFGPTPPEDVWERAGVCLRGARELGATVLLKGHVDVVCPPGPEEWPRLNLTGNPGMTVGGTGDVLAGAVAGLMAQCGDPIRASAAGAFLVGRAGDLALAELSYSMTASDVLKMIPRVLREILG